MSFGYDANIANFLRPTSTNNIHYHAKALLDGILLWRKSEAEVNKLLTGLDVLED
jgi:hypothetical protein